MSAPSRSEYHVVIVGAGVIGLYTAYHLARSGAGPILVVDRGFLSSGASGRNGGGVRQQWETRSTIRLTRESVDAYRHFARDFGVNPWFRQSGYIFLAEDGAELERLRRVHDLVRSEGLPSQILDSAGIARLVPGIAADVAVGGTYLATDGTLYPFPVVWGLYEAVRNLGVEVLLGTEALGVRTTAGRLRSVTTSRGTVSTSTCVNAAGGWSREFSERAGLTAPNAPTRHEILATEPLKPFLDPMVVRARDGLYFSQTMRGEIVGGVSPSAHAPPTLAMSSSLAFLARMAGILVRILPSLASVGVLRAWSGLYDDTPDGLPVLGEDPRLRGFVHANGFGGHGMMLAPSSTARVARMILEERVDLDPAEFGPQRFDGRRVPHAAEALQLG